MSDIKYNLQFEKLCHTLELGDIVGKPEPLSGGLLHRMYAIQTTKKKYAIKALNPQIMLRPTAMENYINSERIVNIASKKIPALPAKAFNGTSIHKIDNQFYLIFDWVNGRSLKPNEIGINHCEKIGGILADIHMTGFTELDIMDDQEGYTEVTDWQDYLKKGQEKNTPWVNLLLENTHNLYAWNEQAIKAERLLASDRVISHRDLDPKNVMWNQNNPLTIDWEAAGYTNPMHELTETAIYWAEDGNRRIDKERFLAFIDGYKKKCGTLQANWSMVLVNGFSGKLGWLEYNLKRSLWIECTDEKEQKLGTQEVTETIRLLIDYADVMPKLEEWLNNEV